MPCGCGNHVMKKTSIKCDATMHFNILPFEIQKRIDNIDTENC